MSSTTTTDREVTMFVKAPQIALGDRIFRTEDDLTEYTATVTAKVNLPRSVFLTLDTGEVVTFGNGDDVEVDTAALTYAEVKAIATAAA